MTTTTQTRLLTQEEAAGVLTRHGFTTTAATLATKRVRGGGPQFRRYGRYVRYAEADLMTWAEAQISPPYSSTAEEHVTARRG